MYTLNGQGRIPFVFHKLIRGRHRLFIGLMDMAWPFASIAGSVDKALYIDGLPLVSAGTQPPQGAQEIDASSNVTVRRMIEASEVTRLLELPGVSAGFHVLLLTAATTLATYLDKYHVFIWRMQPLAFLPSQGVFTLLIKLRQGAGGVRTLALYVENWLGSAASNDMHFTTANVYVTKSIRSWEKNDVINY